MTDSPAATARWQFELTWSLFEVHLADLGDADFLWEAAPVSWTVREGADGVWRADFAETEPDPIPVPTIGWLTWHIGWWWSSTLSAVHGADIKPATEVPWPGSAATATAWLRSLRGEWLTYLDGLGPGELSEPAPFPWPDRDHTVAQLLAWVNLELAKNVAEIGQLRLLRAAGAR